MVGFGDITAASQLARALVTAQIFGNLVLISLGIRILTVSMRTNPATTHRPT